MVPAIGGLTADFNPRAPYGARRQSGIHDLLVAFISIHAPHTGRDSTLIRSCVISVIFQSTRPIRGATGCRLPPRCPCRHFNPRAPYGARRQVSGRQSQLPMHFNPRAPYGARHSRLMRTGIPLRISIHAPHTGRDSVPTSAPAQISRFQSTRPIRGATCPGRDDPAAKNFNPRAPYGARHSFGSPYSRPIPISIHAPHTGRDPRGSRWTCRQVGISIHAPHTGRDEI